MVKSQRGVQRSHSSPTLNEIRGDTEALLTSRELLPVTPKVRLLHDGVTLQGQGEAQDVTAYLQIGLTPVAE